MSPSLERGSWKTPGITPTMVSGLLSTVSTFPTMLRSAPYRDRHMPSLSITTPAPLLASSAVNIRPTIGRCSANFAKLG